MRGRLGGCQLKWKTLEGKYTSKQPPVPSPQQLKKIFPSQVQFCHACPHCAVPRHGVSVGAGTP